jgi:hypothetical protein
VFCVKEGTVYGNLCHSGEHFVSWAWHNGATSDTTSAYEPHTPEYLATLLAHLHVHVCSRMLPFIGIITNFPIYNSRYMKLVLALKGS